MSIIFGTRRAPGQQVQEAQLLRMASATKRYAPDGTFIMTHDHIGMGFQPYHTHLRSKLGALAATSAGGNMLAFDGRLDNHNDLRSQLDIVDPDCSDSSLVLAAFGRWEEDAFSQLTGDWALALWSIKQQTLYLARDHAGARTLYFHDTDGNLRWSTHLETFFAEAERHPLNEEYAAQFLCGRPLRSLTPYRGILAVRPAHYIAFQNGQVTEKPHWNPRIKGLLRYNSDAEYDEHFLMLFRQSVERRTGPGASILAQLSGGMDSTSIVCMSDFIRRAQGASPSELLDTVSYFNRTEPTWDEKPYFTKTEAMRGKAGLHIESSLQNRQFEKPHESEGRYLLPGPDKTTLLQEQELESRLAQANHRVILSGIGGDEVLGGVPTPMPELADYLVSADLRKLARRTTAWCIFQRTPLLSMLYKTAAYTVQLYLPIIGVNGQVPSWVNPRLRRLSQAIEAEQSCAEICVCCRPSSISNAHTWSAVMETLPHLRPDLLIRREYRYPYLDKDLVSFLFRVPREQLVGPGRRRLLMRRALRDIVPVEILERRRKAYLARGPLLALRQSQATLHNALASSIIGDLNLIDMRCLLRTLDSIAIGNDILKWPLLLNALVLALWLNQNSSLTEGDTGISIADRSCLASAGP